MKVLNFIVSSLGGAVTLFILGFLIYGLLLMDTEFMSMDPDMGWRQQPDLIALFVGEWMVCMLLALVNGYWSNNRSFGGGAWAGALVGLFFGLAYTFSMYAFRTDTEIGLGLLDTVITIIRFAIAGGVVAVILGAMSSGSEPAMTD